MGAVAVAGIAGSRIQASTDTDFTFPDILQPPEYDAILASVAPNDPMSSLTEQPFNLQFDLPLGPDGSQVHEYTETDFTLADWFQNPGYDGFSASASSHDQISRLMEPQLNLQCDLPRVHEITDSDYTFLDSPQNPGYNAIWASAFSHDHMSALFEQHSLPQLNPPFTDDEPLILNGITIQELTSTALDVPINTPEYDGFSTSASSHDQTSNHVKQQSQPQSDPSFTDNEPPRPGGFGV